MEWNLEEKNEHFKFGKWLKGQFRFTSGACTIFIRINMISKPAGGTMRGEIVWKDNKSSLFVL